MGETVQAKCKGWTKYYPGKVIKVNEDERTVDIKFEDGESKCGIPYNSKYVEVSCVTQHHITPFIHPLYTCIHPLYTIYTPYVHLTHL